MHRGMIDLDNEYMSLRADDYPGAAQILVLANFKRDKTVIYEAASNALNQGLVIWPKPLNIRNEMEFEETREDGSMYIRYEKPSLKEMDALIQLDLAKEELMGIQKSKRPNGTVVFEPTPEAKQNNLHDDRADCVALACWELMKLRASEALDIEKPNEDFSKIFSNRKSNAVKKQFNPFGSGLNPFNDRGSNPFKN